jgi:CxxC motif-containing protein (DUF1111 family)
MLLSHLILLISMSFANTTLYQAGGEFSSIDWSQQAFNHPFENASKSEKREFGVGNSFFKQSWVEFPSSTIGRDGLGPTYNAVSCSACHVNDGKGIGYIKDQLNVSLLFRISQKKGDGYESHPDYGDQFQPFGIAHVKGEGTAQVKFIEIKGQYQDGSLYSLRKPLFTFNNFKASAFDDSTVISPRVAPHLVGLGLIEAIAPEDILKGEDPQDLNKDGVTGKANIVWDVVKQSYQLGLFGWKAGQPSLMQQNAAAFLGDMGLTTSLFPEQNCPLIQTDCLEALKSTDTEVSQKVLERITTYTQILAVPKSRDFDSLEFKKGREIFDAISCSACHRPEFKTSNFHSQKSLNNQFISPYSDFLLHDMGEGLADHRPEAKANGFEWRTPPLWSLGLIPTVNKHSHLLHDGRARNIEEAILWHDGEARFSKLEFKKLNSLDRKILINFISNI